MYAFIGVLFPAFVYTYKKILNALLCLASSVAVLAVMHDNTKFCIRIRFKHWLGLLVWAFGVKKKGT